MVPKVFFVTGASSGFGRALIEATLERGYLVVATLRHPEAIADLASRYYFTRLLVLELGITKQEDIDAAFARAKQVFGRVDVVINNAALEAFGELEGTSERDGRGLFDTTFWGNLSVTKQAIQFFREESEVHGGRIIQISDAVATNPNIGLSMYSAARAALEAAIQALSGELDPQWKIKLSIVIPGGFKTEGAQHIKCYPQHPAYTNRQLPVNQLRSLVPIWGSLLRGDPRKAAEYILNVAEEKKPRLRYVMGKDALSLMKEQLGAIKADIDACEEVAGLTDFDVKKTVIGTRHKHGDH